MVEICPTTSVFWCNQKKLIHFQFFSCCKNGNVTSKHFPVGAESISHTGLFSNIFIESLGHTENIKKCKMHRIKYCSCTIILHMCYIASVVSDSWWRSPPGFLLRGILQARIVEWVAMPSSKRSSQPRYQIYISYVSCIGRPVLYYLCHLELFQYNYQKRMWDFICMCVCYIYNIKHKKDLEKKNNNSLNCDSERNVDYEPGFISDSACRSYKKQVLF